MPKGIAYELSAYEDGDVWVWNSPDRANEELA